jgi:class 3 adenylate cyclase
MAELPTGTLTFVFTDLERSTGLWEERPEAMKQALARHDAILRGAVEAHDGHVVKTTGDGVHAVFASAHDALEASLAAQRALTTERWPGMARRSLRCRRTSYHVWPALVEKWQSPGATVGEADRGPANGALTMDGTSAP